MITMFRKHWNSFAYKEKASVLAAQDQKCIGVIALSDVLRPEAKDIVSCLSDMHTRTVLLTGDHQKTADYFAQAGWYFRSTGQNFCRKKK